MRSLAVFPLLLLGVVASCGGGGGDGTSGSSLQGANLRILLTDSPVDAADAVFIVIDRVDLVAIPDWPRAERRLIGMTRDSFPAPLMASPQKAGVGGTERPERRGNERGPHPSRGSRRLRATGWRRAGT